MRIVPTAAVLSATALALAACTDASDRDEAAAPGQTTAAEGSGAERGEAIDTGGDLAAAETSVPGAPVYARPYPGAEVQQSVQVPGEDGGMLVLRTDAHPDTVIAYYQQRAEEAGMASGAQMTQGDTRMYGAVSPDGSELNVVVAPVQGQSTVTVTWSAG